MEDRKLQTMSKFNKSQLLKKAFQFLFPLSVFSFLFSYSLWLSFFVHSFNFYFSTFSVQIISDTIDKKYVFLLCNGIIVILVKNSGLIVTSPFGNEFHDELCNGNGDDLPSVYEVSEIKASAVEKEIMVGSMKTLENLVVGGVGNELLNTEFHDELCNGNGDDLPSVYEVSEIKASAVEKEVMVGSMKTLENVVVGGVGNELLNTEGENEFLTTEDKDEENGFFLREEEEGIGGWSTEELNKKCDDFIKRVREGIRIEAQQQLVIWKEN